MKEEGISSSIYSGFSLEQPRCPIHLRIYAYAVDMGYIAVGLYLALFFGVFLFALVAGLAYAANLPESLKSILVFVGVAIVILAVLGATSYYFISHELKCGATPGKKLVGLRVVSLDGRKLTLKQCVLRDLLRQVDALLIIPGLVSMLLNKQHRRLGDLASGTMVIYLEKDAKEEQYVYIKQNEYHLLFEKLKPITPENDLIQSYLTFSFSHFIKGQQNRLEARRWNEDVRMFFCKEYGSKIDKETALLFFAELCNQVKLEEQMSKEGISKKQHEVIENGNATL